MMAAPRPQQGVVSAEVEVIDDEYVDDGFTLSEDYGNSDDDDDDDDDEEPPMGALAEDGKLSLESDPNGWDDLDDLDALESLNPFDVSRSLLEDAGLLPVDSIEELEPVSPLEEVADDVTPLSDDVISPLSPMENALAVESKLDAAISAAAAAAAASLMQDLLDGGPVQALVPDLLEQVDSLPPEVELVALPVYDFQTSHPGTIAAAGQQVERSHPARIARRLWQRDMNRMPL